MSEEPIPFCVRCKNPKCGYYITTPYFTTSTDPKTIAEQMEKVPPLEIPCHECGHVAVYGREDLGIVGGKIETPHAPSNADTEEPQEP